MPGEARKLIAAHAVTMPKPILHLAAMAALLLAASAASAQSAAVPAPPCDSARADTAAASADVVVRASVSIAELRFQAQPRAAVRVTGCEGRPAVRVVQRRNLPERVEPGVTYRDVYVAVEIVGRAEAACLAALTGDAALAQALGGSGCASPAGVDTARAPPHP